MFKTLTAVNNLLRTFLSLGIAAILGFGGWIGYRTYSAHDLTLQAKDRELEAKQAQIQALSQDVQAKQKEIERLDTVVRLLKVDHRVAQIRVVDQRMGEDQEHVVTTFKFVEVDQEGHPLDEAQTFTVQGDVVYIDAWVVKFMDEHVEQADELRSTSVCLFRRIFGEFQEPKDGFVIDAVGSRPNAYGPGSDMSDFEREIWSKFWDIANDPLKAKEVGVRAAQGEAPSIKLKKGKLYRLELRASGGLTIVPDDLPPAVRDDAL